MVISAELPVSTISSETPPVAPPVEDTVHVQTSLGRGPAVAAKERRRRPVDAADVLSGRAQLDPRHQRRQVLERAVGGNRRQHVIADDPLGLRALHVDDRRLAGDGDRLGDRADLQVLVDRRHERPCQFDPSRLTVRNPASVKVIT